MIHPTNPSAVRVKRDGQRGWHWVINYDPAVHELLDDEDKPAPVEAKKRGRPSKQVTEADNGDC